MLSVVSLGDVSKEQVHAISEAQQKAAFVSLHLKISVSFQSEVTCLSHSLSSSTLQATFSDISPFSAFA